MAGQRYAQREDDCAQCYRYIAQDDPIWFNEGGRYCTTCACKLGIDCPKCHGSKRPDFALCYECNQKEKNKTKKASLV